METLLADFEPVLTTDTDFLPLNGTDYIELYVGNSKQAAHYFQTACLELPTYSSM